MTKRFLPFLLLLASLAAYSTAARRHPFGTYATETDFYHFYGPDAARIAAGEFPENPYQGPGYPALVALTAKFTGDAFTAGKWISVFCAVFALLLVYMLFARLGDGRIGRWMGLGAAALAGLAPQFPQFAISASTDALFLMLALAALLLLVEDRLPVRVRVIGSGAVTGLAYTTRYNGVFLVVAALTAVLAIDLLGVSFRARCKWALLFAGVFLLTASPWLWANYTHRGSPLYNANYLNMATEFYPELVDGRWNQDATRPLENVFDSFADVIAYDPKRMLLHYPRNLYESAKRSLTCDLVSPWVGWAALAGILIALYERRSRAMTTVLVSALLYFLLMGLNHWETRYYFFLGAIYSGMAVYAAVRLFESARARGYINHRAWALLPAAFVALLAWKSFVMARSDLGEFLDSHPWEVPAACEYLRSRGISNARVVARKPHLAYMCGQKWVFFPETKSVEELGEWLKTHEVDYVSFGVREVKSRPELRPLRDPNKAPGWLRPEWRNENPPLILYRPNMIQTTPHSGIEQ